MMDIKLRPVAAWSGERTPAWRRERMPGIRTSAAVFGELEKEVRLLGAVSAVVETFHRDRDLRQDGRLRANAAQPSESGVALYVTTKAAGPLRFACDKYVSWLDNLRAITLTLEALRGMDRWGVAKTGEQYRGWVALPPPPSEDTPQERAAKRLLDLAGFPVMAATVEQMLGDERQARSVYNEAVKRHHPDVGGERDCFEESRKCWQVLAGLDG